MEKLTNEERNELNILLYIEGLRLVDKLEEITKKQDKTPRDLEQLATIKKELTIIDSIKKKNKQLKY